MRQEHQNILSDAIEKNISMDPYLLQVMNYDMTTQDWNENLEHR